MRRDTVQYTLLDTVNFSVTMDYMYTEHDIGLNLILNTCTY